ncbi:MAG: hypothetical protein E1N59_1948 [Puniceicoccaceae bacterium 5H]|nr:MAG: hypothetical protein E1N59_1948 [Puniceicoccaceae bacterium 5H]
MNVSSLSRLCYGLGCSLALAASTQAFVITQESFETIPGAAYTLSNTFDDGTGDFFDRYEVPDLTNLYRSDFQNGWDGNYGIMGQDFNGEGYDATQVVAISNIDTSLFQDLTVSFSVGAISDSEFPTYEPEDGDSIELYATFDSGPRYLVAAFRTNGSAGDLYNDTDLDGVGDGAGLTESLAEFIFPLNNTGNLLTLEFEMTSTDSFETLALDDVVLEGVAVPESSTAALAAAAAAGLLVMSRRKR